MKLINNKSLFILVLATALLLVLTLLLVFSFNNATKERDNPQQEQFFELLSTFNANHSADTFAPCPENPERYKPPIAKQESGITNEEFELIKQNIGEKPFPKNILQAEEAISDVELLYKLLRYCYSGYSFFGGDKAFFEAKDELIEKIKLSTELSVENLEEYLIESLSIVNDGHFLIGNNLISKRTIFYYNDDIEFHKDETGFFSYNEEEKRYVTEIDADTNFEERMFLSLNQDGKFVYYAGKVDYDKKGELSCSIHFDNESIDVILHPPVAFISGIEKPLETTIPIVRINSFLKIFDYDTFLEGAAKVRDSAISIIDLRGNMGGDPEKLFEWLRTYNPSVFNSNTKRAIANYSLTINTLDSMKLNLIYEDIPLEWMEVASFGDMYMPMYENNAFGYYKYELSKGYNSYQTYTFAHKRIDNENIIIVLIDKNSCSAAEVLIANFINIDNVVFVGTNSRGASLTNTGPIFALPNSKINIRFGQGLSLTFNEDLVNEGEGYYPDIWVPEDTLNKVIKMLEGCDFN